MTTFRIEGMTCDHCARAVRKALEGVPGVKRVEEVSVQRKEAVVEGTPRPEDVAAAVREEGYEARPLEG